MENPSNSNPDSSVCFKAQVKEIKVEQKTNVIVAEIN